MSIIETVNEISLEVIAIGTVGITIGVIGIQALYGQEITMPTEPLMMILGFYFAKKT